MQECINRLAGVLEMVALFGEKRKEVDKSIGDRELRALLCASWIVSTFTVNLNSESAASAIRTIAHELYLYNTVKDPYTMTLIQISRMKVPDHLLN